MTIPKRRHEFAHRPRSQDSPRVGEAMPHRVSNSKTENGPDRRLPASLCEAAVPDGPPGRWSLRPAVVRRRVSSGSERADHSEAAAPPAGRIERIRNLVAQRNAIEVSFDVDSLRKGAKCRGPAIQLGD